MQHYIFSQIDSWFFRESRSMDGSGATALDSVFPPANQTLLGALRTQIGEQYFQKHGGNWSSFSKDDDLSRIIGYGNDYAQLKAQGAWLYHAQEEAIYFPAPSHIVQQGTGEHYGFFELPREGIESDLGKLRLPQLRKSNAEHRDTPLEQSWISAEQYSRVLRGEAPTQVVKLTDILTTDTRLGISRDNQTRRTEDGMLYQTKHQRLANEWRLYLGLDGIAAEYQPKDTILRLGGEARMAALELLSTKPNMPEIPKVPEMMAQAQAASQTLILSLLTPLPDYRHASNEPPLPAPGFKVVNRDTYDIWQGQLNEEPVNIMSAVVGKLQRIGGWDMAKHRSQPVRSYVPAGSCWYLECTSNEQAAKLIQALHLSYLTTGQDRAQGYGQIAVGLAPKSN